MTAKTFTVEGQRVRTSSQRRFVAFRVNRLFDGVNYEGVGSISIFKRSDSLNRLRTLCQREGFHSSRWFVIIDTSTGEQL